VRTVRSAWDTDVDRVSATLELGIDALVRRSIASLAEKPVPPSLVDFLRAGERRRLPRPTLIP